MKLNDRNFYTSALANTWYHVVIQADPISKSVLQWFTQRLTIAADVWNVYNSASGDETEKRAAAELIGKVN